MTIKCKNCGQNYSEGQDESRGLGSAVSHDCCTNPEPMED